jgi:hypothetical protein
MHTHGRIRTPILRPVLISAALVAAALADGPRAASAEPAGADPTATTGASTTATPLAQGLSTDYQPSGTLRPSDERAHHPCGPMGRST